MSDVFLLVVQIIFVIADFSFFCFSIIGNSVVIYVIARDGTLKSKNYHIISLAVADLLIGLFGIPLGVQAGLTGAPHDFFWCLCLNSFLLSVFSVAMFSLVAVSADRCWAVCKPVTYHVRGTKSTKIIIAFCWIFGILFGFFPVFGWNSGHFEDKCDLRVIADMNYLLVICVAIAFLSTLVIIFLHIFIYRAIVQSAKRRQEIVANTSEFLKQRSEIKAAITLGMIVATFLILWLPGIMSLFIMAITNNRDFHIDILELSTILVHLNAALDPLIYAYRMKNIREALNKLFICFRKKQSVERKRSANDHKSIKTSSTRTSSIRTNSSKSLRNEPGNEL